MSTDPSDQSRREQHAAWDSAGLIMAGVAFWGGLGWLVAEWAGNTVFLVVGLLLGSAAALYLVWVRYGRA